MQFLCQLVNRLDHDRYNIRVISMLPFDEPSAFIPSLTSKFTL